MVATTHPMHTLYRQSQLPVDTSNQLVSKFIDEDDYFDEPILDNSAVDSGLEMSPPMVDSRRDSFAFASTLFSPKQEDWQPAEMQSMPAGNPFEFHSNNPFFQMNRQSQQQQQQQQQSPHHHAMGPHMGSWPMTASTSAASAVATPVVPYDGLHSEFDTASLFQRAPIQTPFAMGGGIFGASMHGLPAMGAPHGTVATNTSSAVPMQLSSSGASIDTQPTMKKLPPSSPMIRSHNELRRGDGIRKKNARFDIPAERNLNNIDQLIQQSTDEQEIKELKQQKRLLRNRQAALDSRQRKKQHTERLEDEKKHYAVLISDLEQGMERFKQQAAELMQEKQSYEQYIESLNMEKEEMIRQHTIETADLRKKINVLTNHVQALDSAAAVMPNHVSAYANAGVGAATSGMGPYSGMDGIAMDGGASGSWESLFPGMPNVEHQQQEQQQTVEIKTEMQLIPSGRKAINGNETIESTLAAAEKSGSQGGLLFMLFLVGAFVMSSRQTPSFPPPTDEIRAASATLLNNVFKDAGVPQNMLGFDLSAATASASAPVASVSAHANAPMASSSGSVPWSQSSGAAQNIGVEPSVLGQLSDQLMQPTEEQSNEQLFSLTAAQYNGVVDMTHLPSPDRTAGSANANSNQGRRNLAEALSAMRGNSKAEVYTRSLLWDQIPSDVVRTFAKMVSEVNSASPRAESEN
ncbi:bzip transcription factor [Ophiostoma piceae UAMH 11346]|uniref:Bzip transcription factor n=1 Tax=Ophiostoma piceae (strain UAMH 11346) TaxID=1262450 RepID=S3CJW3_OPHP1|nr:bzip transcription factor [Ophiostoma piceae UAMH 11346]